MQTFFRAGQGLRQSDGELTLPWLPLETQWTLDASKYSLTWWSSKHWHICLALFSRGLPWLLWVEHGACVRVCSAQSCCSIRRTSPLVGASLCLVFCHTQCRAWVTFTVTGYPTSSANAEVKLAGFVESQTNLGWEGRLEVSPPPPCSEKGHFWRQIRLIWAFSRQLLYIYRYEGSPGSLPSLEPSIPAQETL